MFALEGDKYRAAVETAGPCGPLLDRVLDIRA
jgi:hypothetical protein